MKATHLIFRALPAVCLLSYCPVLQADPATGVIKERQEKVLAVVKNSGAAVVNIGGVGSGVLVSKDGLVLTAGHVAQAVDARPFRDEKGEFNVTLADGREVRAKALGRNMNRDSALIQITTVGEYPIAEMADEKTIHQGDWCVAMGHPGGYIVDRTAPVRTGRLWQKDEKKCYRTDCTVSGGDSGGPLFDLQGKIIGIHSSIGERLEENRHVPISAFKEDMDKMKEGKVWGKLANLMPELAPFDRAHGNGDNEEEAPEAPAPQKRGPQSEPKQAPTGARPFLGVVFDNTNSKATVGEVVPDSPAEAAGLQANDVVLKVDGKAVGSATQAVEAVGSHKPGEKVKLSINRNQEDKEIEVTLGKR
jgi:serine protease Do